MLEKLDLCSFIMRIKVEETSFLYDKIPYMAHLEREDQRRHEHHKQAFLAKNQVAVTKLKS